MIYRDFQGQKLSALGFGTMRLPVLGGDYGKIDEKAAAEMFDYAIAHGVNYFDTAWGYHDGESERAAGNILSAYPRDKYFLATKFPGYDLANMDKVEEIFEVQLKKCRTDHFDFYLFHNVCEKNIDEYLDERHGIFAYLKKQKESGRIRHLGFSAHGSYGVILRFLEKYGEAMEFCQLQVNYLDWSFQNAKEKVELIKSRGIPVWVMEPLRGGRLAHLSEEEEKTLKAMRPEDPVPAWAFRFLQSLFPVVFPVLCILFIAVNFDPRAFFKFVKIKPSKFSIVVNCIDREIDVSTAKVGMPLFLKGFYNLYHVINMIRRLTYDVCLTDVKPVDILKERIGIKFCNFINALLFSLSALAHLIFPVVSIPCKMSDIGNIHDVFHLISV